MCLGCNEMKPKRDLIRIVKSSEGEVSLDFTGKNPEEAHTSAVMQIVSGKQKKARRFEKSLSCKIDESVYEVMENELTAENR